MTPMPGDYSNTTNLPVPKTQPRRLNRTQRSVFSQDGVDKIVVLTRLGKPPLRFKGCRLTHHSIQLSYDKQIQVELWQQRSGGFAICYSTLAEGVIGSRVIQVCNLAEANDCLENICTNVANPVVRTAPVPHLWTELYQELCFKQQFSLLVADVLSDWSVLPQLQEHAL